MSDPNVDPIDSHVGARVKLARQLRQFNRDDLAKAMGVTWQQLEKYERGVNRVACARLYRAAVALQMPIPWFFEDIPTGHMNKLAPANSVVADLLGSPTNIEMLRRFASAEDRVREGLLMVLRGCTKIRNLRLDDGEGPT